MLRWLERPGLRLVALDGHLGLARPSAPAACASGPTPPRRRAARSTGGMADRRDLRPVHQPGAMVSRIA